MASHRAENTDLNTGGVGVLTGDRTDIPGVLTDLVRDLARDIDPGVTAEKRDLTEEVAAEEAPGDGTTVMVMSERKWWSMSCLLVAFITKCPMTTCSHCSLAMARSEKFSPSRTLPS